MRRYTAFRWFPLIFLLSIVFQLPLVQAQDSGGQTFAAYELIVNSNTSDRFCLGQTAAVQVKVQAHPLVVGGESGGRVRVLGGMVMSATSQDFSIASADFQIGHAGLAPDVPFQSTVLIKGEAVGRTSVEIKIAAQQTNRFGAATSFQLSKTIPVNVVPCEYLVAIHSEYLTTMYRASTLISTDVRLILIESTDGIHFSNDPRSGSSPRMKWDITANRIPGCRAGHARTDMHAPSVKGTLLDDQLVLQIDYEPLAGLQISAIYLKWCPNLPVHPPCTANIDGVCPEFPVTEAFTPAGHEGIEFPLGGATVTVHDHSLIHRTGRTTGTTIITVQRRAANNAQ
ncbi:MAG: hypothetical protein K8L91_05905 [Anaerolineae bacterium]|nr:hypothetical protein [Anaerolineae bacterium]